MDGPSLTGEVCHHQRIWDMVRAVANCNKGTVIKAVRVQEEPWPVEHMEEMAGPRIPIPGHPRPTDRPGGAVPEGRGPKSLGPLRQGWIPGPGREEHQKEGGRDGRGVGLLLLHRGR